MGGHAGGDVASSLAVGELAALDGESHGADALGAPVRGGLRRAPASCSAASPRSPKLAGMGTTVTALLRSGDRFALAHIGDSRAYLLRDGELVQVTRDHTFVQRLVDEGRITPEEAERHPQRSVIMRVLGDVDSTTTTSTSRCARRRSATAGCCAPTACPTSSASTPWRDTLVDRPGPDEDLRDR